MSKSPDPNLMIKDGHYQASGFVSEKSNISVENKHDTFVSFSD